MNRNELFDYALKTYGTKPEYLWKEYPNYAVLRHFDDHKWYAIVMNVPKSKLEKDGTGEIDVVDVKCDPAIREKLLEKAGIYPGYHMNKKNWISIALDGRVDEKTIKDLLETSVQRTDQ